MSKVYITAIRLSGGTLVRHITHVWYGTSPRWSSTDRQTTTVQMADWIDDGVYQASVHDLVGRQEAQVQVVRPPGRPKYLRTNPDNDPNDNLLSLPQK